MNELSTEQAFAALEAVQQHTTDPRIIEPLRLALVRLRELETKPELSLIVGARVNKNKKTNHREKP